jgi:hypothetical protein
MFGIPYKIMASILVGTALILAVIFAVGLPLNLVL